MSFANKAKRAREEQRFQLSQLSDGEYSEFIYRKKKVTDAEMEGAIRLENAIGENDSRLEDINRLVVSAIQQGIDCRELREVLILTCPAGQEIESFQLQ